MSIFSYLFDNDYLQRRDIERLERRVDSLPTGGGPGLPADIDDMRRQLKELSALVHVLVTIASEKGTLDLADVKTRLAAELARPAAAPVTAERTVSCVRCGTKLAASQAVKIGRDMFCHACAANP
jgi:hypothetical protein